MGSPKKSNSHRQALLLHGVATGSGFLVAAILTFWWATRFDAQTAAGRVALLQGIGGALLTLSFTIFVTLVLSDQIRDYMRDLVAVIFTDKDLVEKLAGKTQREMLFTALNVQIPECAAAFEQMVDAAISNPAITTKRNPQYYLAISDLPVEMIEAGKKSGVLVGAANYYLCKVDEHANMDAATVLNGCSAVFVLEEDNETSEALHREFEHSTESVIYRDWLILCDSERASFRESLKKQCSSPNSGLLALNASSASPYMGLIEFSLEITLQESMPVQKFQIHPTSVQCVHNGIRIQFAQEAFAQPKTILKHSKERMLHVRMMAKSPIDKKCGSYPIILSSFSYDPEIRVRFTASGLEKHNHIKFMVCSATHSLHVDNEDDGNSYRIRGRRQGSNAGVWVFPGSGVIVRWKPK